MTITRQDASIVGNARAMSEMWCVFEHLIVTIEGQPPQVIYVGACRLNQVFEMRSAKNNSDWSAIFATDRPIMLRIIATADTQTEAVNESIKHARTFNPLPRCNLHGFNMFGQSRRLRCNNGEEYATQTEAAKALGISQGAISRHLKGHLNAVNGYTFTPVGAK